MFRLSVRGAQLDACIRHKAFAVTKKYDFAPGEKLILQVAKNDCPPGERVRYALVFDNYST